MEMIKFNEEEKIGSINGALALRGEINRICLMSYAKKDMTIFVG